MTKTNLKTKTNDTGIPASAPEAKGGDPVASAAKGRTRRGGKLKPDQAGADLTQNSLDQDAETPAEGATGSEAATAPAGSKLNRLVALLGTPTGATLPELVAATGWQVHSVRGAMAGALRKKGHSVISEKSDGGLRRYRIGVSS